MPVSRVRQCIPCNMWTPRTIWITRLSFVRKYIFSVSSLCLLCSQPLTAWALLSVLCWLSVFWTLFSLFSHPLCDGRLSLMRAQRTHRADQRTDAFVQLVNQSNAYNSVVHITSRHQFGNTLHVSEPQHHWDTNSFHYLYYSVWVEHWVEHRVSTIVLEPNLIWAYLCSKLTHINATLSRPRTRFPLQYLPELRINFAQHYC